mgnify:FL=1
MKKKLTAVLAAIAVLCMLFSSCSGAAVMSYGKTKLTYGQYKYLFASLKNFYLETYSDIKDSNSFWDKEAEGGQTYGEFIDGEIKATIRDFVISAGVFDKLGYTVGDEAKEKIKADVDDAVELFGGRSYLSAALSELGLDEGELEEVYTIQYKYESLLYEHGISAGDDSDIEAYYNDKYVCGKVIYISTKYAYVTDENGQRQVGDDGYYKMRALTDDEKRIKDRTADDAEKRLGDNSDAFDEMYTDSSLNDLDVSFYPRGMYFCSDEPYASGLNAVSDAIFALDEGEWTRTEDENGVYFVKRETLPEKAYDDAGDYIQFSDIKELCARSRFREVMDGYSDGLQTDEEKISDLSVKNVEAVKY